MFQNTVSMTAALRTFPLQKRPCVTTLWTVFSTQAQSGKPMFRPVINIFLDMLLRTHITFIGELHMVCTSQPPNIGWQTFVQALENFVWFATIFWIKMILCRVFTFMEKENYKKLFRLKKFRYFLYHPRIYHPPSHHHQVMLLKQIPFGSLLQSIPIVHCPWLVFKTTSSVRM